MKKKLETKLNDDLRPAYDLSTLKDGVRGKYAQRFKAGTTLFLLSPDVAKYFPDDQAVNSALKTLVGIAKVQFRHAH
ncbi:MAG: hypothetical protein HY360_25065 [Verrucomicrobia bacterium]|nr:hypothetical protein [Verrucomicrobiota bacterium]